jgi:hypothetical protein
MLIRVIGPNFVAGIVFDEDGRVHRTADIVKWAKGMTEDELRGELRRRGLTATRVRTLTRAEIKMGSGSNDDDRDQDSG